MISNNINKTLEFTSEAYVYWKIILHQEEFNIIHITHEKLPSVHAAIMKRFIPDSLLTTYTWYQFCFIPHDNDLESETIYAMQSR